VPVLKDPDHRAENRAQHQQIESKRLYRHHDAAREQEQQNKRRQRYEEDCQWKPVCDSGSAVDERGGGTAHLDLVVGDLRTDITHQLLSRIRLRAH